jgi:hypothetical protein
MQRSRWRHSKRHKDWHIRERCFQQRLLGHYSGLTALFACCGPPILQARDTASFIDDSGAQSACPADNGCVAARCERNMHQVELCLMCASAYTMGSMQVQCSRLHDVVGVVGVHVRVLLRLGECASQALQVRHLDAVHQVDACTRRATFQCRTRRLHVHRRHIRLTWLAACSSAMALTASESVVCTHRVCEC